MSELKAYRLWPDEVRPGVNLGNDYYLKSEADKVIAELESRNVQLRKDKANLLRNNENLKLEIKTQKLGRLNDKIQYQITERHSKYKRCLAIAKYCELREDEFGGDFAKRWLKIWLKLAEEPTWEKFLQLIHKEAK